MILPRAKPLASSPGTPSGVRVKNTSGKQVVQEVVRAGYGRDLADCNGEAVHLISYHIISYHILYRIISYTSTMSYHTLYHII